VPSRFSIRFFIRSLLIAIGGNLVTGAAWAQVTSDEIFTRQGHADLALSWLKALFRGQPLGDDSSGAAFTQIAESIRHILGLYSVGMLVLAGFLLLYYTLVFVAQTANTGHIAWGQKNKLWAPLRFALVIGLLVPVGGGLNLGQYVIVKLTEQGSALASNAWQSAAETMKDSFAGLVTPRSPDLRPTTMRAVEMALCRSVYRHIYTAYLPDEALASLGSMTDLERLASERLSEETWRYGNALHDSPPLCGAYRFLAPSSTEAAQTKQALSGPTGMDPLLPILGDSARASAERLSVQASAFAETVVGTFLQVDPDKEMPDAQGVFTRFLHDQNALLNSRITALATEKTKAENELLAATQESGWISAGWILLDLMNRQALLGNLTARSIPTVEPPLLGHSVLDFKAIDEKIKADPTLRLDEEAKLAKVYALYDKASTGMKKARAWLYQNQIEDPALILASSLDIDDRLAAGSDSEKGFAVFRRLMDSGFASYGVWGRAPSEEETLTSLTLSEEMKTKPMAALAEMGRRYTDLGSWMMGAIGRSLSQPAVMMSAAIYVFLGGLLALAGLALLYLVPMIPLFRFVAAVLMWLLLVFEAVASVPLVAIAHMNPSGEGLASETAKRAYGLWLSIFIRPFLIVFGFLVGWAGFFLGLLFLNTSFSALAAQLAIVQIDSMPGLRAFVALLYALLVVMITNIAFKGISFFPERAIEWIGGMVQSAGSAAFASAETSVASTSNATASSASLGAGGSVGGASAGPSHAPRAPTAGHPLTGGASDNGPHSRESQFFPQFREKDIPSVLVAQSGDGKAVAASGTDKGGQVAAAGARADKQSAVAIATAKASIVLGGDSGENALSDLAREAKEIILGEKISESADKSKDPHESEPQDIVLKEKEEKDIK